jgi:hypothetical protein
MSAEWSRLFQTSLTSGIPEVLRYWANEIEKTANELCNDPDCKRIQFKVDVNRNCLIDTTDDDVVECLMFSFKKLENRIPKVTKEIIQHLIHVYIVKKYPSLERRSQSDQIDI